MKYSEFHAAPFKKIKKNYKILGDFGFLDIFQHLSLL